MERNGQGAPPDQTTTRQRSGSAGATLTDSQEAALRRASFVTYRRYSSTVGPQEASIPGDPVAFRREDYLSRPSWLFDIGRYPVTLCPHLGDDGVPQKTSTGAPIYAAEERNVRRPSWSIDTSQCARIVHYGARRKSSTGAPYFVTADQAGRRSSELSDTGQFPPMPSVSTVEDKGLRKSSLAFATEDGHLHTPCWLENTNKYTTIAGPQTPEGGVPRRPSTGTPLLGTLEDRPRRPSIVSQKDSVLSPHESRRRSIEAPVSSAQEEPQPRPSGVLDKYPSTTGPHLEDGAPHKTTVGAPVSATQDHHLRRVSWVADKYATPPSLHRVDTAPQKPPTGAPASVSQENMRRLAWLKEKYPFMSTLHQMFGAPQKRSKGAPIQASQVDHPPRSYWISDSEWKDLVYPSSKEEKHLLHSLSPESSDDDSVITEDIQPSSGAQMQLAATAPLHVVDNVALRKTDKVPKPSSPIFPEDRDIGNLAARKYSAARATKVGKGEVSSEVTKTMPSDLSPHRDSSPPAALRKVTAEDDQLFRVPTYSKKGRQEKQHRQSTMPISLTIQTLQEQGSKTLLMQRPASSPRLENKVVGDTITEAVSPEDDVKLDMTSSKISKKVSFGRSLSRDENQASKHLADRNAANKLRWGKAASSSKIVYKTLNFQTEKEGTSRTQTAQATLGVEDSKQAGTTLLSESMQESESSQSSVATSVDIQATGTHSTAKDTTLDKTTESTKILDQTASPSKAAVKSSPSLQVRTKELTLPSGLSKNNSSTQSYSLLSASYNLESKEPTPVKDDSTRKYALQTLHLGRVKLLPTMFQPVKWKLAGACDLKIIGTNFGQNHAQRQKSQELTKPRVGAQELTTKPEEVSKHRSNQNLYPVPPPSPYSSLSSEPQNPYQWMYSKNKCSISQAESTNQKDKNQCHKSHKLPQLEDNLQQKRLEALRRVFMLEDEILLQYHQKQQ